jgi:hypothetical protein
MKKIPKGIKKYIRREKRRIRKATESVVGKLEMRKIFSKYYKKEKEH